MESAGRRAAVDSFATPSRMLGRARGLGPGAGARAVLGSGAGRGAGLGLLAALVAALALTAAAPQSAQAQQDTQQGIFRAELRIALDDSDAIIPVGTTDLGLRMVLRVELNEEIEADDITAVSASGIRLRSTHGIELIAGTAATDEERAATCRLALDETLIWECTVASYTADFFGLSAGEVTLSADLGAEYSLTITGANNDEPFTGELAAALQVVTLVEDVVEIASVTLESAEGQPTTRPAGGDGFGLVLKILNANDAAADPSAITSIFVTAAPLMLDSSAPGANCSAASCSWSRASVRELGARGAGAIAFIVSSDTAGSSEVNAQVISDGVLYSAKSPRLTFSGPASRLALGEPSGALLNEQIEGARDQITIPVTATDARGNDAVVPARLTLAVQDPEGRPVAQTAISRERRAGADGKASILLRTLAAANRPLPAGEYTLRVSHGSTQSERSFRVAGKAAAVALSELPIVWSAGVGLMRVIADVTDAQGQPVADGTPVVFSTQPVTAQLVSRGALTVSTVGGRASLEFLVVQAGTAAVTATADGQQATDVVTATPPSAAGATGDADGTAGDGGSATTTGSDATGDEVGAIEVIGAVGLDGLGSTQLGSFTTWLDGTPTTAGTLYDLLTPQGATALWSWRADAQRWIPYSELTDGRLVPGAVDFTITRGDILWLSG